MRAAGAGLPFFRLLKLGLQPRHAALTRSRVTARSQHHRPVTTPPARMTSDQDRQAFFICRTEETQPHQGRLLLSVHPLQFWHQLLLNHIFLHIVSSFQQRDHLTLTPPYALVLRSSSHLPGQYMDRSSLFQLIQEQVSKQRRRFLWLQAAGHLYLKTETW